MVPVVAATSPSVLKQRRPLASPAKPRTPVWPAEVGVAQYTYDVVLPGDEMAVLRPVGVEPPANERLYPDFARRLVSWLSRNVGEFVG
jgi:hypothetical protein